MFNSGSHLTLFPCFLGFDIPTSSFIFLEMFFIILVIITVKYCLQYFLVRNHSCFPITLVLRVLCYECIYSLRLVLGCFSYDAFLMMHAVCFTLFLEWSVHAVVQWSIPLTADSPHKMYNSLLYVIHVCVKAVITIHIPLPLLISLFTVKETS